jgi:putative intracellular protease/amidase
LNIDANTASMGGEIVIVATSATALSNGHPTGAWAEEIAAPWYVFKDAGYKVTVASPKGEITLDKVSLEGDAKTAETKKWLEDDEAQKALKNSIKLSAIDTSKIVGIFGAGGHGAVVDFPDNKELGDLVTKLYTEGKVVSTVCHGAELFKGAVDAQGVPIVKGKRVTGFSDSEEKAVGLDNVEGLSAPESVLRKLGASYSKASSDWGSHVEVDSSGSGPLITGQNPGSSAATAKSVVEYLSKASA